MAALVFFTSLFLLATLLSVTMLSALFSRRSDETSSKAASRTQRTRRQPRQKRQPARATTKAGNTRRREADAKPRSAKHRSERRRWRLPRLPIPPALVSCLPLGLVLALMAAVGQLAVYGMNQAHEKALGDPRLVAFANALGYLGIVAMGLLLLGVIGLIAGRRNKP